MTRSVPSGAFENCSGTVVSVNGCAKTDAGTAIASKNSMRVILIMALVIATII